MLGPESAPRKGLGYSRIKRTCTQPETLRVPPLDGIFIAYPVLGAPRPVDELVFNCDGEVDLNIRIAEIFHGYEYGGTVCRMRKVDKALW